MKVTQDRENSLLILERTFDAPREKVWSAFSNADNLSRWWGPRGWETTTKEFSFTPGGAWHYCMKCTDQAIEGFYGQESWGKTIFQEIESPEKFVYRDYFCNAEGEINEAMPGATITMEFMEEDGKTKILSHSQFESTKDFDTVIEMGVVPGITETWDRLEEFVTQAKA
ncbi:MAG: ATPase [Patescibacteria group bacterium]|nr:ATPase [Patescibacteria group bacterium]